MDKRLIRIDAATFGEAQVHYEMFLRSALTLPGLRSAAPEVFQSVDGALRAPG